MSSLAALTQVISNSSPSVAATNFSNYSTTNISSPKHFSPSAQNNIVPWKDNSAAKLPNNQSDVSSDKDDQKNPFASFLKWLGTKVLPDAIGTFFIGFITYAMSHYVLATMPKNSWIGRVPGLRVFHENVVKINDAIREDMGSEAYNITINQIHRPGAIKSVEKFWTSFEKVQSKIAGKEVSEKFLSGFYDLFKRYNRLTTGVLIAVLAWTRTVFFSTMKEENDEVGAFSLPAILSAGMPLLFAGIYWTFYEFLTSKSAHGKFVNPETNTFKFGGFKMPFMKKFEGKSVPGSLQEKMDLSTNAFKVVTKASKRFNIDLADPVKSISHALMALFLSFASRDFRTEGAIYRPVFKNTEKFLNKILKPLNKDINIQFKFRDIKKGYQGLENELNVPGIVVDTSDPEKQDNLTPSYDPEGNDTNFVYISAFKAGLKLICDSILFSIAFKWINSLFSGSDNKKKKKGGDSSSSTENTNQQWTPAQMAGLGLTIATATAAVPLAYSMLEKKDDKKGNQQGSNNQKRQLSYA